MAEEVAKLRRIELDVTDLVKEVLGSPVKLVKDLHEDEVICGRCGGLGFAKWETPFRTEGDPDFGFPHTKEAFTQCPACYTGVQTLCKHCNQPRQRGRLDCTCDGDFQERAQAQRAKEEERRKHCQRIPYSEYKGEALYDDDTEDFVYDGDDLDHTHTYFACTATKTWVGVDKDDVLERIKERASEEVEDGGDLVDWDPKAEEELEQLLQAWFDKHVSVNEAYWPDRNTIVVVSPTDVGIVWDEDDDELDEDEAKEHLTPCTKEGCYLLLDKRKYGDQPLICKRCRGVEVTS